MAQGRDRKQGSGTKVMVFQEGSREAKEAVAPWLWDRQIAVMVQLRGRIEGNEGMEIRLWSIRGDVSRAYGWWNLVMGHMVQGSEGNKAVGHRLRCIRKGYGGK